MPAVVVRPRSQATPAMDPAPPPASPAPPAAPAVTVLMSVYNGERYLRRSVDSVLAQTYTDFEFLILDDGSTDGSLAILREYAAADPRVRLVSRPNKGLTKTLNEGLHLARGRYVARMDGDDVCLPRRLAVQVEYLDRHPDVVLVGGQVELIDPDGLLICLKDKMWLDHADIDQALMTRGWPLVHPAVTMRRDALLAVNGFDETYVTNQDHDLFLRLAEYGRVANLPDVLLQYRQHFESVSLAKADRQAQVVGDILRQAYARRGLPFPEDMRQARSRMMTPAQHYTSWCWDALAAHNRRTARWHAWQVLRRQPLAKRSYRLLFCAIRGH